MRLSKILLCGLLLCVESLCLGSGSKPPASNDSYTPENSTRFTDKVRPDSPLFGRGEEKHDCPQKVNGRRETRPCAVQSRSSGPTGDTKPPYTAWFPKIKREHAPSWHSSLTPGAGKALSGDIA